MPYNIENNFYTQSESLRDYFESLPIVVKHQLLESGAEITTLGELQKVAEHFMQLNQL